VWNSQTQSHLFSRDAFGLCQISKVLATRLARAVVMPLGGTTGFLAIVIAVPVAAVSVR
jgi:hypothetical protein